MSNSFGKIFRISTFGESHGKAIGVTIDGCPPRIDLTEKKIQNFYHLLLKDLVVVRSHPIWLNLK